METPFFLPAGSKLQWSTAISMMVFAWLFAAFWSVMPLLGWGEYDYEPLRTCCTLDYSKGDRWGPGPASRGGRVEAAVPWRGLSSTPKPTAVPHCCCGGQTSLPSGWGKAGTTRGLPWLARRHVGTAKVSFLRGRGWRSGVCYSLTPWSSRSCICSGFRTWNSLRMVLFLCSPALMSE